MRSRSSRLFVVLLHLVGVSRNFPSNPFLAVLHPDKFRNGVGIVGVHPLSILLEPLELQAAGGLAELLSLLEGAGYDVEKTVLGEPYWLQDDTDGKCLGPDGFSECGDATLWKIRRRLINQNQDSHELSQSISRSNRKAIVNVRENPATKHFLAIFGWDGIPNDSKKQEDELDELDAHVKENKWEYALELVDVSSLPPFTKENQDNNEIGEGEQQQQQQQQKLFQQQHQNDEGECVVSFDTDNSRGNLEMGPCASHKAWSWSINEGGILKWDEKEIIQKTERPRNNFRKILLGGPLNMLIEDGTDDEDDIHSNNDLTTNKPSQCLWRYNETIARTEPCNIPQTNIRQEGTNKRLVGLSVIQYQNTAAVSPKLPRFSDSAELKSVHDNQASTANPAKSNNDENESHLPHTKIHSSTRSTSDPHKQRKVPMGVGGYSERPNLSLSTHQRKEHEKKKPFNKLNVTPLGVGGGILEKNRRREESNRGSKTNILHHTPTTTPSLHPNQDVAQKVRKMPVHPYIAASKDGVYVDPNTGLDFLTDIHAYLGHDREESGRHTLMGVGLYTRTMLKIKVYSVGLYMPKRDVLADANFKPFADMTVEELRASDSFYQTLLNEGSADKTLFIKLNMQLAAETVRQSLSAEWKLLSDEHKAHLSNSSARPRDAEPAMLEKIKSEENSSNCSCGQIAPPEYEADPSCCARGTELVFTWRKNGNLELRIDGRMMDTFTDPIIGKGIFFEYLRGDDPMSFDARDHFVDGFPFLLAPLAQVKGLSSSIPNQEGTKSDDKATKQNRTPFAHIGKFTDEVFNNIMTSADEVSSWVEGNIKGGITNVGNAANAMNKNAQKLGAEFDRRRNELFNQMSADQILGSLSPQGMMHHFSEFQKQSLEVLNSRTLFFRNYSKPVDTTVEEIETNDNESKSTGRKRRDVVKNHLARMFDETLTKRPLSDEIGVIIEPTMSSTHLLFLYMVHFYLVLLLIVSVPDLHKNRVVVRRSSVSTVDSESDNEERLHELEGISSDISCWDEDKGDKVPEFVIKDNEDTNQFPAHYEEYRTKIMKKSLSYYL